MGLCNKYRLSSSSEETSKMTQAYSEAKTRCKDVVLVASSLFGFGRVSSPGVVLVTGACHRGAPCPESLNVHFWSKSTLSTHTHTRNTW
eukprot:5551896-Amphidinium_carterae.1